MNWSTIIEGFKIGDSWFTAAIVWLLLLAALGILLNYRAQIRLFTGEVRVELAKASWPWEPKEKGFKKYKELSDSTVIVVIAMLLLAGYIAFWDFFLVTIVGALTK